MLKHNPTPDKFWKIAPKLAVPRDTEGRNQVWGEGIKCRCDSEQKIHVFNKILYANHSKVF